MSDEMVIDTPMEVAEIAPAAVMDTTMALREVLKKSLVVDGLARGLREAVKALDQKAAHMCVFASNCDEERYTRLIKALCDEHKINLIEVPDKKDLGEWVGLCKIDKEGAARKRVGCSCVVVKDYGPPSEALNVLLAHFESKH